MVFLRLADTWVLPPVFGKLVRSLLASPHLSPFVTDLSCGTTRCDSTDVEHLWELGAEEPTDLGGRDSYWWEAFKREEAIDLDGTLSRLFNLVAPNLRRLTAVRHRGDNYDSERLLSNVTFSSVVALEIDHFGPSLAASFPSLAELKCGAEAIPIPATAPPAPALASFTLTTLHPAPLLYTWLTSTSHASLRALTLPFVDLFPFESDLAPFRCLESLTLQVPDLTFLLPSSRPLPPLPVSLRSLTLGHLALNLSPATSLSATFLSSLSAPNLVRLALDVPHFRACIYTELVADKERLPSLEVVVAGWKHYSFRADEGWEWEEREKLRRVCEERGVQLRLPSSRDSGGAP
ncbi:hypothetical protein JCM10213_003375 [Rhodosporidiobolus nylandii]